MAINSNVFAFHTSRECHTTFTSMPTLFLLSTEQARTAKKATNSEWAWARTLKYNARIEKITYVVLHPITLQRFSHYLVIFSIRQHRFFLHWRGMPTFDKPLLFGRKGVKDSWHIVAAVSVLSLGISLLLPLNLSHWHWMQKQSFLKK